MTTSQSISLRRRDCEIFFVSVLILYLELVLIRWVGTEIRIFAYLGNLILVACFFGVGLGCYFEARPVSLARLGLNLSLLAFLVANPFQVRLFDFKRATYLLGGFQDYNIWQVWSDPTLRAVLAGMIMLAVLTYLVVFVFVPAGQILGHSLQQHPHPTWAYSVNIAGSLVGVWLFQAVSWASWSPPWWFALAATITALLVLTRAKREWTAVATIAVTVVIVWPWRDSATRIIWSPYQKLAVSPHFAKEGAYRVAQGYELTVNDASFQLVLNLSEPFLQAHPEIFNVEDARTSYYNLPFAFKPDISRMLIVGAGTGNNAAAALRHGVNQIDCVEIDPRIYAIGRELHPEQPYSSPHVHMVVNDARAFFKQSTNRYDAIWFALLDAHTLGSSFNNLRLDHYVYTRESFQEAKRLLTDDGLLVMNFSAPHIWLADRLFGMLRDLFGHDPLAFIEEHSVKYGVDSGATLLTARDPVRLDTIADPAVRTSVSHQLIHLTGNKRPTTDDWPYLYLENARIPKLHLMASLTIIATVLLARRRVLNLRRGMNWHFFWLGAAFLLLEVQAVSRAALLFGMTWVVNSIVISAVLVMILLANFVAARWPFLPRWFVTAGLAATVTALALIPLDWLNTMTATGKLVVASGFLVSPVFFSGLVFIRSFAICPDKAQALGSNLIGALVGGLLESLAFITGIRALVILVGIFYLLALLLRTGSREKVEVMA